MGETGIIMQLFNLLILSYCLGYLPANLFIIPFPPL